MTKKTLEALARYVYHAKLTKEQEQMLISLCYEHCNKFDRDIWDKYVANYKAKFNG